MKIFSLSHYDLDGFGCQLCIYEKIRNNITYANCGYSRIKEELDKISYSDYNVIFITDLNLVEKDQEHFYNKLKESNYKGKIIYIDHHIYDNKTFLDKIRNEFDAKIIIDETKSASLKTFEILKITNNNLKNLIELIDIFDIWQEDNPKFKLANHINDFFWDNSDIFRSKMIKQNYKFTDEDKNTIKNYKNKIKDYFDNNIKNGIMTETPKLLISFDFRYSNHCDEYYNKSVLLCNIKSKKFSIRLKNEFVSDKKREEIMEIIKEAFEPNTLGGHFTALGFEFLELSDYKLKLILSTMVNYFEKGITLDDIPF